MSRTNPRPSETDLPRRSVWPASLRWFVSLWLVYHFAAIIAGPLNLPPSILGSTILPYVLPYHRVLFVGHPYKFFAPDPGPSHLIEYDVELADGTHLKQRFPDRHDQWPRLLYHRHFMLTEFVGNMPPEPNINLAALSWEQMPMLEDQRARVQAYADHLLHKHNGQRVTLTLVQHGLPSMEQVTRDHVSLLDERSYRRRSLGTYERGTP